MKFIHISDTHLGYAAYRKLSDNGYNQREEDILAAFRQAITQSIALRPDFIIHSGDLFDVVRPTNRILHFAIEQILRLVKAKLPTIIISGNHETPKQRYLGNALQILAALPVDPNLLFIVHQMKYEVLNLPGLAIHAVPQCRSGEEFEKELNQIKPQPNAKNILVAHCGVKGLKEFSRGDFNELLVDFEYLKNAPFDYIALGHFHNFTSVTPRAYFSGSTERMSFNETGIKKGFIEVTLVPKLEIAFHELKIRPMQELETVDAKGKDAVSLQEEILSRIQTCNLPGKILRIKIKNLHAATLAALDIKKIREAARETLHFEPLFEKIEETGQKTISTAAIGGLNEEFIAYLNQLSELSGAEKELSRELGLHYLSKTLEETEVSPA
jgi:DNA repair exonuclease SbcCD nuclease subunit